MKRRIHCGVLGSIAILWLSTGAFAAADLAGDFDSANKLYAQGRFPEAAAAYEKLLQSGVASPTIYFNLGNAFFKSGESGRAIAAYRQAGHLAPRDPDIQANLQFVRNQVQGPTHQPAVVDRCLGRLTVNEWTVLASIALWIWLLSLIAVQIRPALKQSFSSLLWLSGSVALALGICLGASWSARSAPGAVVTAGDAPVRNGPLDESPTAFIVHDGAELSVLDKKDDWLEVSAASRIGWLKREDVVLLQK